MSSLANAPLDELKRRLRAVEAEALALRLQIAARRRPKRMIRRSCAKCLYVWEMPKHLYEVDNEPQTCPNQRTCPGQALSRVEVKI